jgi:two-component system, NarL family, sensor histidine kinase UhpB
VEPGSPAERRLREAHDVADAIIGDVRELARTLRPDVLDTVGLIPAIANLVERMRGSSAPEITWRPPQTLPRLPPDVELCIYRVAQEALTNVVRHAQARAAEVALSSDEHGVQLTVNDDGVGIPPGTVVHRDGAGTGVRSMRERALLAGGRLELAPRLAGGTQVRLLIPPRELRPHP